MAGRRDQLHGLRRLGQPNVNLTLFNFEGAALPSIGIFQNPAAVCTRYAPDSSPCVVG